MSKVTRQKQNPNKRLKRDNNNKAIGDDFLNKETVTKERSSTTACQKENLEMDNTKKSVENENPEQKDVIPQNSLENYSDARKLLRSLRTYIHRIGNKEALLRVHEIDTVLVYVIKNARRYGREV